MTNLTHTVNCNYRFTVQEIVNETNQKVYYYIIRSNVNNKVVQDFFISYTNVKEKRGHANEWQVRLTNGINLVNDELYKLLYKKVLNHRLTHTRLLTAKKQVAFIIGAYNG